MTVEPRFLTKFPLVLGRPGAQSKGTLQGVCNIGRGPVNDQDRSSPCSLQSRAQDYSVSLNFVVVVLGTTSLSGDSFCFTSFCFLC